MDDTSRGMPGSRSSRRVLAPKGRGALFLKNNLGGSSKRHHGRKRRSRITYHTRTLNTLIKLSPAVIRSLHVTNRCRSRNGGSRHFRGLLHGSQGAGSKRLQTGDQFLVSRSQRHRLHGACRLRN